MKNIGIINLIKKQNRKMIIFQELKINEDEKLCYIKDKAIKLTKSEYNILVFLLTNRNKIFSREKLIEAAWAEPVTVRAVDTAMSRLRKKLGEYGKHIITRLGFGYGFKENID